MYFYSGIRPKNPVYYTEAAFRRCSLKLVFFNIPVNIAKCLRKEPLVFCFQRFVK